MEQTIEVNVNELAGLLAARYNLQSAYIHGAYVAKPGGNTTLTPVGLGGALTIRISGTPISDLMPGDRGYIPKFCEDCGARLEWGKKFPFAYDEETGQRKVVQRLRCPNKKWWQITHRHPKRGYAEHTTPYSKFTKEKIL